ncbi:ribonuclease E activity regulator RraA [Ideonella sp. 4Y11]|uniref:4-hydroxy-4-methyl-2-oxoglutarate aldolase n=1 Tax=Ideonella aquatica TaxID=2824119 RepID=A0A941BJD8_9BURK|nr:ribonuclease E activity regulator RraA [Ideonella aquatica]MBQ0958768.1 ribonuclease E activity regulator RraA [Ideonella aquatica]
MNADTTPSTCDLCDAHKSDSSGALRVLPPVFHHYGARTRFAGTLSTVQCLDDNSRVKEAVNTPGQGRVLLVDAGGTVRRSMVGGLLAEAAAKNGWAGVVVWGAVRDKAELAAAQVGVVALALTPMPTDRKDQGLRDVPVQIDGLLIRPGEYLVADEDGIVVLPTRP